MHLESIVAQIRRQFWGLTVFIVQIDFNKYYLLKLSTVEPAQYLDGWPPHSMPTILGLNSQIDFN